MNYPLENFKEQIEAANDAYETLKDSLLELTTQMVVPNMVNGVYRIKGIGNEDDIQEMKNAFTIYDEGQWLPAKIVDTMAMVEVHLYDEYDNTMVRPLHFFSCESLLSIIEWLKFVEENKGGV